MSQITTEFPTLVYDDSCVEEEGGVSGGKLCTTGMLLSCIVRVVDADFCFPAPHVLTLASREH